VIKDVVRPKILPQQRSAWGRSGPRTNVSLHAGRGDRARHGRGGDLHKVPPVHAQALEALSKETELIVLTISHAFAPFLFEVGTN